MPEPRIDTSLKTWDEVKTTTCYMCACRCGIKVYLKDGTVKYIEGDRDHPVNRGVICGKGAAGIMQHYSPARLSKPLLRVGERGKGEFREIEWEEALRIATLWLSEVRNTDPKKLAFFTGRDQSQALTGWWATQFGTPNYAAHGGFCSVNMAAAGIYTFGGSFWEFGEPDWKHTKYFMLFGVAEDHASNPIKIGLGQLKKRGVKIVSVNPVRTGYSAIADEWVSIRPGTDGLFAGALVHELLRTHKIDLDYLARYTNAPWLAISDPGGADHGLFARDRAGDPLVFDAMMDRPISAMRSNTAPKLVGTFTLADGRSAVPSFQLIAERFLGDEYSPEAVASRCGIEAATIRRIAAELARVAFEETVSLDIAWMDWAGRFHDRMVGRPVSMHAMRGISAHSNGFHTCRILHLLQILLGTIDVPGGYRYRPPFPKPVPPHVKPAGKPGQVKPNTPLPGPPLGFVTEPEDLLVDKDGRPQRIDKAFSWEAPIAAHGLLQSVIANAAAREPYGIEVLFLYMSNMGWNSAMNVEKTLADLTKKDEATGEYAIPKIIYSDAYASETVWYADLVLPDTTYLERWDCISLLDRPISEADGPADSIRQPVVAPDRDVRPFQDVLLDLGARLGLPGMTTASGEARFPGGYADYIVNHERSPGIGPLAGWRGEEGVLHGRGGHNPKQLERYIENGCHWFYELPDHVKYYRHANRDYLEWAQHFGFLGRAEPIFFQIYCEPLQKFRLAAQGHGSVRPPPEHRVRIERYFDPVPFWYAPFEECLVEEEMYPLHAITQRPMAQYHSWGSQNAWLRQIIGRNWLYMNRARAGELGLSDGDWVRVTSAAGEITAELKLMDGTNRDTVWTWNAIGKRAGSWNLDSSAPEAKKGFLLNHLIGELLPAREDGFRYANADPITGQAAWYDLKVRVEKVDRSSVTKPQFPRLKLSLRRSRPGERERAPAP
ncbi:MAG: molybdopterin oxidoreductase family protein [Hyphomicrobiales bacterium]